MIILSKKSEISVVNAIVSVLVWSIKSFGIKSWRIFFQVEEPVIEFDIGSVRTSLIYWLEFLFKRMLRLKVNSYLANSTHGKQMSLKIEKS